MSRDRLTLALVLVACLAALAALAWRLGGADGVPGRPAAEPAGTPPAAPPPALPGEAPRAVHGRVVEATTGEGLPGFRLRLASGGRELGEARSGADGGFRFPYTNARGTRLAVLAPAGYAVDAAEVPLDPAQRAGDAPLVVVARRAVPLGVAGRLVDAATGEPLPRFALKVGRSGREPERVETDAAGRFRSRSPLAAGAARLELVDAPGLARPLADRLVELPTRPLDPATPLADLALDDVPVAVGPTFRVTLAPLAGDGGGVRDERPGSGGDEGGAGDAPDTAALLAVLVDARLAPDWTVTERDLARAGLEPGWGAAPVRTEPLADAPTAPPAWVRFASAGPPSPPGGGGWTLELRDRAGLWAATARVPARGGVHTVRLVPRRTARVAGRVVDAAGAPRAGVALRLGAGAGGVRRATSDAEGRFALGWVPPGEHVLRATAPGAPGDGPAPATVARELELAAGATTTVELELARPRAAGAVSGTLRSESGANRSPSVLRLVALDAGAAAPLVTARVEWQRDEAGWHGAFRFADVPHGRYELRLAAAPYGHRWSPPSRRVEPPAARVDFTLEDATPLARLGFRVLDAASGAELERFALVSHPVPRAGDPLPPPAWVAHGSAASGRTAVEVAEGLAFDWLVVAEGYRPASGDRTAFASVNGPGEDDAVEELCTVRLARGWGACAVVVDGGGEPLAGVAIADGAGTVLGTTNAGGWTHLALDAPPAALAVRRDGWSLAGGNLRAEGGFTVHNGVLWVALRPR